MNSNSKNKTMSCCGNRDVAPAIAPLSEDFFSRSVELILPGHSSDIRLVYENDQWQNAGIEKSVEYKSLLERCKVLEREKKELKAKYDEALRKLAILSLEHEKLQNATEIHVKKNI
eukprot:XP_001710169.1 Hypothetical protein GL50803_7396 [Giardia lamblia ATCC 50803]